ncbi:hypothetical protein CLOM_g23537 [Closterium sp. NIES-68]|nr:hypothetical protein CLOM_g23537 [Closterium sp. NIES-68]GJP65965.1 hypothetical protein CLOP_g22855 [Closterium sp. NIES-67]
MLPKLTALQRLVLCTGSAIRIPDSFFTHPTIRHLILHNWDAGNLDEVDEGPGTKIDEQTGLEGGETSGPGEDHAGTCGLPDTSEEQTPSVVTAAADETASILTTLTIPQSPSSTAIGCALRHLDILDCASFPLAFVSK